MTNLYYLYQFSACKHLRSHSISVPITSPVSIGKLPYIHFFLPLHHHRPFQFSSVLVTSCLSSFPTYLVSIAFSFCKRQHSANNTDANSNNSNNTRSQLTHTHFRSHYQRSREGEYQTLNTLVLRLQLQSLLAQWRQGGSFRRRYGDADFVFDTIIAVDDVYTSFAITQTCDITCVIIAITSAADKYETELPLDDDDDDDDEHLATNTDAYAHCTFHVFAQNTERSQLTPIKTADIGTPHTASNIHYPYPRVATALEPDVSS